MITWKERIKHLVPVSVLNSLLLTFPSLYRTRLVRYESNLSDQSGIDDLLAQLGQVIHAEGDIIECGSSRCGSAIIMANYLRERNVPKLIYACDSFRGFLPAELEREKKAGLTTTPPGAFTSTSLEYVRKKIRRLGAEESVIPVPGFFQDTLPHVKSAFCLALIDCDLSQSLVYAAETVWPSVVKDGRMLFDDYASTEFRGARLGIEHFVGRHASEISERGLLNRLYYIRKR